MEAEQFPYPGFRDCMSLGSTSRKRDCMIAWTNPLSLALPCLYRKDTTTCYAHTYISIRRH